MAKHKNSKKKVAPTANSIKKDVDEVDETTSSELESFLLSYESMMRQQELELAATLLHLQPLLDLLLEKKGLDFHQSMSKASSPSLELFERKDLKVVATELREDSVISCGLENDQQLAFALEILTSKTSLESESISWIEIVLCYRQCILGLQTLGKVPEPNELRGRIRRQTMDILSTFSEQKVSLKSDKSLKNVLGGYLSTRMVELAFLCGAVALALLVFVSRSPGRNPTDLSQYRGNSTPSHGLPLIPGPVVPPFDTDLSAEEVPLVSRTTPFTQTRRQEQKTRKWFADLEQNLVSTAL